MRKLASIQTIKYVKPIPDADSIETVSLRRELVYNII